LAEDSNHFPLVPSEVEGREAGGALVARTSTSLGTNGFRDGGRGG
jgi:hypothetical protein